MVRGNRVRAFAGTAVLALAFALSGCKGRTDVTSIKTLLDDPARFDHQVRHTYARRFPYPANAQRGSWANVRMGVGILSRLLWRVGVLGRYRRTCWRMAAAQQGLSCSSSQSEKTSRHAASSGAARIASRKDCCSCMAQSLFKRRCLLARLLCRSTCRQASG